MNTPDKDFDPQEHQAWLDMLAGKERPDADSATRKSAAMIRDAAQHHARWLAFRERLVDQGLLDERAEAETAKPVAREAPASWTERIKEWLHPDGRFGPRPAFGAALVLLLAFYLLVPTQHEDPLLVPKPMIIPQEIVVAVNTTEKRALALQQALQDQGVTAVVDHYDPGWRVTVKLPDEVSDDLKLLLDQEQVALPPPGERQIQVLFIGPGQ